MQQIQLLKSQWHQGSFTHKNNVQHAVHVRCVYVVV